MKKNLIAGLDLGTTKVCAAVGERFEDGSVKVLGFGVAPSEGLHKGLVANIAKTSAAIEEAVEIASNRAGVKLSAVNVGVAGEHITSMRFRNYVTITNPDNEITEDDLTRLRNDLLHMRRPVDRKILHILPEEYFVDNEGGITNPVGISGTKLEATNHIVLASIPAIQNITKAVERAGLQINDYMLQPLASSLSVLDQSEKDLGVLLIDIGGGTTDVAVIHKGAVKHTKVFGVAGNQMTNDIRETLGIMTVDAEQIKKKYGYAIESGIIKDEDIFIKGIGAQKNTKIPVSLLTQIISLRMRELFVLIENDIRSKGFNNKIKAGIILTGGGSLMKGCIDLVEDVFGIPAKIGVPLEMTTGNMPEIEKPEFSTVVGLLQEMPGGLPKGKKKHYNPFAQNRETVFKKNSKGVFQSVVEFFKNI